MKELKLTNPDSLWKQNDAQLPRLFRHLLQDWSCECSYQGVCRLEQKPVQKMKQIKQGNITKLHPGLEDAHTSEIPKHCKSHVLFEQRDKHHGISSVYLYFPPHLPDTEWTLQAVGRTLWVAVAYLLLCLSVFAEERCCDGHSRPSQGRGESSVGNTQVRYQRSPRVTYEDEWY